MIHIRKWLHFVFWNAVYHEDCSGIFMKSTSSKYLWHTGKFFIGRVLPALYWLWANSVHEQGVAGHFDHRQSLWMYDTYLGCAVSFVWGKVGEREIWVLNLFYVFIISILCSTCQSMSSPARLVSGTDPGNRIKEWDMASGSVIRHKLGVCVGVCVYNLKYWSCNRDGDFVSVCESECVCCSSGRTVMYSRMKVGVVYTNRLAACMLS